MPTKTKSIYDVHPSVAHGQGIIANLPAKTGRSIDEWIELLGREGPASTKDQSGWLKRTHKLGGITAAMIPYELDQ